MKKSNNAKMVEILRRLKPERHGAVVEDMARRGISYGLSYGVAIPVIRRVARDYTPDHVLAEYLFRQDVRELKLAAIYIDDPAFVTAGQIECWVSAMPASEIMEHAATNLFYASDEASDIISDWLAGDDLLRLKGALYMAGRRALGGLGEAGEFDAYLLSVENGFPEKESVPQQAAVYFFTRLVDISEDLRKRTVALLKNWTAHEKPAIRELAEEVLAFME